MVLGDWMGLVKPQHCFKSSLIPKYLSWATVAVLNCSLGPVSLVKDFHGVAEERAHKDVRVEQDFIGVLIRFV